MHMHSAVYATARCLSVCLSVAGQYYIETAERIELGFNAEATLSLSQCVVTPPFPTSYEL